MCFFVLQKVKDINVSGDESEGAHPSRLRSFTAQALWFLSTTRNILVVLVCAALAYYFDTRAQAPFVLTGESCRAQALWHLHTTRNVFVVSTDVYQR